MMQGMTSSILSTRRACLLLKWDFRVMRMTNAVVTIMKATSYNTITVYTDKPVGTHEYLRIVDMWQYFARDMKNRTIVNVPTYNQEVI